MIAFGWYGGKYSHLDWLLPLLPESTHYCEPFGGSAAVILNRPPSPVETYNDIDRELVNFFRVLRSNPEALIEQIRFTPFARSEYAQAIGPVDDLSDVERARLFFVRARQARTGGGQAATIGRWANCLLTSRSGMSGTVSRWIGAVDGLLEIADRLMSVQMECDHALTIIERYDSPETLFYCDPPYTHDTRGDSSMYHTELTAGDHSELARTLHGARGKCAVSGYSGGIMDDLFSDWHRIDSPPKIAHSTASGGAKKTRIESLWINYELEGVTR